MGARTILYTGKGGVGKTSIAAASALRCAQLRQRTLIVSTDPAHSLSDSLAMALGSEEPTAVDGTEGRLHGLQVSPQAEMSRHWRGVQEWLGRLLVERGLDHLSAQELTVPPGMDELFALLRLRELIESGEWEVIIVDCAPTGETLRLLSFPDAARWWLDRVFPFERTLLAAAAPLARTVLDIPLPTGEALADIHRLSENLISMDTVLRDGETTTIRLVMNPDRMVIAESMRTFTYLNMFGYLTDAVIVNRVFGDEVGAYFTKWRALQNEHLELAHSAFAPLPVLVAPYFDEEVASRPMLERLADAVFAGGDPSSLMHDSITQSLTSDADGARLRISIPFVRKEDIGLRQIGLELVVTAAGHRRTIILPATLEGFSATGARYEDGALEVTFSRG